MRTLRSHVCGRWHEAEAGYVPLVDPATEEQVAVSSSEGVDFEAVLGFARRQGGPDLRALTFAERGGLLKEVSRTLRQHREELLELSRINNGTTAADGSFDIDGATGTLAYYAALGNRLGARRTLTEGDRVQLSRDGAFWGRHFWVPRQGVAVHVNAFNFPAWGLAEKAACALLAGMPVITKPATSTSLVAHRCVEIVVDAGILPSGALQLICGSTGNLLELLGPQDVVAFTGSAETGLLLRGGRPLQIANPRFNLEADSLNAAVLAPDVAVNGPTGELLIKEVVREITQKTGQKCTAVRRILVPSGALEAVQDRLVDRLAQIVPGNPVEESVTMGPLATAQQMASALEGVARLATEARRVHGSGKRADGQGSPPGKGFFIDPTLLRVGDASAADLVHRLEVFAPVATIVPYDGAAVEAAELVARAGGTLVTSVYTDDLEWLAEFLAHAGATTGRVYVGSAEAAGEAPGSGVALPQSLHGGPGRAGGGEELGGLIGVQRYLQRLAIQGGPSVLDSLEGSTEAEG